MDFSVACAASFCCAFVRLDWILFSRGRKLLVDVLICFQQS